MGEEGCRDAGDTGWGSSTGWTETSLQCWWWIVVLRGVNMGGIRLEVRRWLDWGVDRGAAGGWRVVVPSPSAKDGDGSFLGSNSPEETV